MLSIKPVVYKNHHRIDGTFAVKIRITYQRQTRYFDTPLTAKLNQLTRDLDGFRDPRLCSAAYKLADSYRELLDRHVLQIKCVDDICRIIAGDADRLPTVADYGLKLADQMQADNRQHTAANYRTAIARLNEYAPGLQFAAVTVPWLKNYERHLKAKMGGRGVQMYLSCLRRIYNAAIEHYNADGTERIRRSPFEIYHIPEPGPTKKRALTIEKVREILAHVPTDNLSAFAKDVFLLSFMFCGINTVDLFSLDQLGDDRLTYNRSKTRGKRRDNALISIAIHPKARPLVERWRDGHRFRFSQIYKNDYTFNQAVNKGLKKIGAAIGVEGLQFYAARHSWATIARNDCNVAMDDVAMALCHSQNTVTDIYVKKDFSRIDKANGRVIDLLFE